MKVGLQQVHSPSNLGTLGIVPCMVLLAGSAFASGPEVHVSAGALATMSGDAGTDVTPTAFVEVESPVAVGGFDHLRFTGRLGISSAPGASIDLADPQTFKAAEVGLGVGWQVGETEGVRTLIVAEAGFQTRLPGDPQPLDRVLSHWGGGVRLAHASAGSITVLLGRDQGADTAPRDPASAEPYAGLQAMIYGSLAVPSTKGILNLVGDATVNVYTPPGQVKRDIVRLGVLVDLAAGLSALKGTPARPTEISQPEAPKPDASYGPPAPRLPWSVS